MMPSKELIQDMIGVGRIPADWVQDTPIDFIFVRGKGNNFIAILHYVSIFKTGNWFSRGTYVRIYRKKILVECDMQITLQE